MKTYKIEMTDEQAARFEKLAAFFRMDAPEVIRFEALNGIDSWSDSPKEYIEIVLQWRDFYKSKASGHRKSNRVENQMTTAA